MSLPKRKGFTLIEILVVISILGIFLIVTMGSLNTARNSARVAKARTEVDQILKAMSLLAADTGEWPGHKKVGAIETTANNEMEDLSIPAAGLTADDSLDNFPDWGGPYMATVPIDPWGNPYFLDTDYEVGGDTVVVVGSYGPNGVGLNQYDADDIYKIIAE